MKGIVRKIMIFLLKNIGSMFFSKEYLRGKWFEEYLVGWKWMWRALFFQKMLGYNRKVKWPVSERIYIQNGDNIEFHVDDLHNFQSFGIYFQNFKAKIFIGKGTYIGPNVGIITANHDLDNYERHSSVKDVIIGKNCWIGMNSVIMPGVELKDGTVVGAGSIVTKSFNRENIIIAGNPAKVIKEKIDKIH